MRYDTESEHIVALHALRCPDSTQGTALSGSGASQLAAFG